MLRYVYWQAPLWEVVLAIGFLVAAISVLLRRVLRRPAVTEALRAVDSGLADDILFHFHPAHGVTPLSEGADRLLALVAAAADERGLEAVLVAALVRAAEQGDTVLAADWPTAGRTLIALGLPRGERDIGRAIAVVALTGRGVAPAPANIQSPVETGDDLWQPLGADVMVHRHQPTVQVRRPKDGPDETGHWQRHALAYAEERLLRVLLDTAGQVLPGEQLFAAVWPDEPVHRHGLRTDQRDRLRRLVFQLRQHVEPIPAEPRHLRTAHGVGYALYIDGEPEVRDDAANDG